MYTQKEWKTMSIIRKAQNKSMIKNFLNDNQTDPLQNETEKQVENQLKKRGQKEKQQLQKETQRRTQQKQRKQDDQIQYKPHIFPLIASYLRRDGADNAEIAEVLGVPTQTITRWCNTYPAFNAAVKTHALVSCERVVRALVKSALGQEFIDIERHFEIRKNPVTGIEERVLLREKEMHKRSLPNPLACFFYLQNRDKSRWAPQGAKGSGSDYTPEQVAVMMRAGGQAINDATVQDGLSETG